MFNSKMHFYIFVTLIAVLPGCAGGSGGIGPLALVKYHQVGACNGYATGGGAVSTGPNAAYVVFKIEAVDNRAPNIDFNFDPERIYVNQSSRRFVDNGLTFARDLGVIRTVPVTVKQGTLMGINGYSVIVVTTSNPDGSKEANQTAYLPLLYNAQSGDPGVAMTNTDASRTSWPQTPNCLAMTLR